MKRDEQWLLEENTAAPTSPRLRRARKRRRNTRRIRSGSPQAEPLAYVVGWQPFLGLKIYLDSHPLIPRSETEWWTEQLLRSFVPDSPTSLLRSRSGPLGQVLLPHHGLRANLPSLSRPVRRKRRYRLCGARTDTKCASDFGEIDPAHEATILKNIRENNLDTSRADVRIGDLFEPFGDMKFDIIAVNPPYIPADRELPHERR